MSVCESYLLVTSSHSFADLAEPWSAAEFGCFLSFIRSSVQRPWRQQGAKKERKEMEWNPLPPHTPRSVVSHGRAILHGRTRGRGGAGKTTFVMQAKNNRKSQEKQS